MKCRKCGAELMDTDKFCNQCGWKVVEESKCPECGTPLREGTKFCPKCGSPVGAKKVSGEGKRAMKEAESPEIPIADIEQNILFETEKEIHKSEKNAGGKKAGVGAVKPRGDGGRDSGDGTGRRGNAERDEDTGRRRTNVQKGEGGRPRRFDEDRDWEARRTRKSVPAPEERRRERTAPVRKKVYEDWDDEDEDDDDDDEDEDNDSIMTIVSVVTAFLILALAAFVIFTAVRKQSDKDYGNAQEETENDNEGGETENSGDVPNEGDVENEGSGENGETSEGGGPEEPEVSAAGTLTIVSNVNVRDNPSTEGTSVIKVAKAGETYEFTGTTEDNNWYIVVLEDGSTGYIFEKYVTVN